MQPVIIVTGSSRGIGRAIIDRLCHDNTLIIGCARRSKPCDLPKNVIWLQTDITEADAIKHIVAQAAEHGKISALVNNAGIQLEKTLGETTDSDWDKLIGINCKAVFNLCRAVLPIMQENGGNIVNIGSISGMVSDPKMALYNASKGFIHSLTRSIAVDYGPKVRCNAVCPGWITTDMTIDAFDLAKNPEKAKQDAIARHPLRRLGTPQDIADVVAWLLSNQSAFINGQCITVDGGLTAASPLQPGLF